MESEVSLWQITYRPNGPTFYMFLLRPTQVVKTRSLAHPNAVHIRKSDYSRTGSGETQAHTLRDGHTRTHYINPEEMTSKT